MDVLTPGLTCADLALERQIQDSHLRWIAGRTPADRVRLWEAHRQLLTQRSPAAVEAMERAGGLAHV